MGLFRDSEAELPSAISACSVDERTVTSDSLCEHLRPAFLAYTAVCSAVEPQHH